MQFTEIHEKLANARETANLTTEERAYMRRSGAVLGTLAIIGSFTVIKKVAKIIQIIG